MKCFEGRGHKGKLWEADGRDRQFLGVLDCFRLFLEVKSLVERDAYIKAFGVLLKWPLERTLHRVGTMRAVRCQQPGLKNAE